jgi:hypothetical protein
MAELPGSAVGEALEVNVNVPPVALASVSERTNPVTEPVKAGSPMPLARDTEFAT